jgi:glycerol uptake facilitator-like aquaporin
MSSTPLLLPREPNPLVGANQSDSSALHQDSGARSKNKTPDYRSFSITLWPNPSNQQPSSSSSRHRGRHGTLAAISCRMRLPLPLKNHVVATVGEFFGTASFLFFAFLATNIVNTAPTQTLDQPNSLAADPSKLLFICLSFGVSLAVNIAAFAPISGGMLNPAVTLGLLMIRQIDFIRAALVIPAQLIGGILAAGLAKALMPSELKVATGLSEGTSVVQGFFIESLLTAMLVFVVFMATVEKKVDNAPAVIGLALFSAELA